MKLVFYGADKEVTGSCHCLEVGDKRYLFDCGMRQGGDGDGVDALPFAANQIDGVFVTHAHVDHSGWLPLLAKCGYHGPIYATGLTCRLLEIMLMDSARIQEQDAKWKARKKKRAGEDAGEAIYTVEDAQAALELLVPCSYGQLLEVDEHLAVKWYDAGHLLGSACLYCTVAEGDQRRTVIFSGDIGNVSQPIIRDPQPLPHADYVVMESTYGNRLHDAKGNWKARDLAEVIDRTLARGGNVIIPAFAVGRTQDLLYHIREIKAEGLVKSVPNFPVYVDSPLALEATRIYDGDLTGYADEETLAVLRSGFKPISFPNLNLSRTSEQSIALNADLTPKVILSSSGMCEAGRIRHHLKHNLWRPECTVLFVGYQANGSLGRILVDGAESVKLFGEQIAVCAEIVNFFGMSAHADRDDLLGWLKMQPGKPQRVFVVHGDEEAATGFGETLKENGYPAYVPNFLAEYDLLADSELKVGIPPEEKHAKGQSAGGGQKQSAAYQKLLEAQQRIIETIRHNQGGTNADLNAFTAELLALAKKWDR